MKFILELLKARAVTTPMSERLVLACAERVDGAAEIEALFEMPTPIAGEYLDEDAIRRMFFDVPSGARH